MIYACAKPVIIDVVGAHSTGKTTAIDAIAAYYQEKHNYNVIKVPSVSRTHLTSKSLKIYNAVDDFSQAYISLMNWTNILSAVMHNPQPAIVCSTDLVVRSLAYTLAGQQCSSEMEQAHKNMLDVVFKVIGREVDIYWIYLPVEFPIVKDNVRDPNEDYLHTFDKQVQYVLRSCKLPFYTLKGNEAERKAKIVKFLESHIHRSHTGECVL